MKLFLASLLLASSMTAQAQKPVDHREQTADQQVQQVLNRLGFGPRPGDVAKVRAMGVDQYIARQLDPARIEDGAAERILTSYEMLKRPTRDIVALYEETQVAVRRQQKITPADDTSSRRDIRQELLRENPGMRDKLRQNQRVLGDVTSAKVARAVSSERQLQEVMTDFWGNHFTVFAGKGITRLFIPEYDRDVIRPNALGKFRDLLGAVAKSPAMLFYLDQWQSAADSTHETLGGTQRRQRAVAIQRRARAGQLTPEQMQRLQQAQGRRRGLNENYARELMELHTLGVDGGYTQKDIIEVARALTGWTMNPRGEATFMFQPQIHDADEKVVLGRKLAAGRGIEDGEDVLDIVARHPSTAKFIARKLAVRFVSDAPPQALVDRAAATFTKTDGDIREVVRTIVTSPEFFSRAAYRSKVKSPFELVASALRAVGAQPDTTPRAAQMVAFLGAPIFGHQAPNGWPETGDAWMNSGAILNRINFGLALASGRLPGASLNGWSEAEKLRSATREQQADAVVLAFFGGQSSPDTRQILMSGENPLAAKLAATVKPDSASQAISTMTMGDGEAAMRGRPERPGQMRPGAAAGMGRPVQLNGLAQVVGLAIGAPEFQRR